METVTLSEKQKQVLENLGVVLCYLHGSVALGTAHKDSDADVAILLENMSGAVEAVGVVSRALEDLAPEHRLDIAILNEASPLLRQIVASTGKILYARSQDDALQFELRAMHDYEYSRHVVSLGQDVVLERVGV